MELVLDVKQFSSLSYRLPIVLSGNAERLMFKCEERISLRIEEFFLVVDTEGLGLNPEDLFLFGQSYTPSCLVCSIRRL